MRKAARADKSSAFKPPFPDFVASDAEGPRPKSYVRSPEYPRHPRTRRDFWDDKKPKRRFERNVQLMALSTDDDETVDWLRAGQALQRAILTGTRYGLSVSFLTQPLERDDIAGVARRWSWQSLSPEFPQVVIRVGYATVPTPAA